jgi:hypothetical protein
VLEARDASGRSPRDPRQYRHGIAGLPGAVQHEFSIIVQELQLVSGEVHDKGHLSAASILR